MKVNVLDKTGKIISDKDVKFLDIIPNNDLVSLALKIYHSNQRESNAHTKERGDVSGSTRKLYKQKGTGNARRGSITSPLLRGGATVFGPRNERNYKRDLPKKMKKLATLSALAILAKSGNIFESDDLTTKNTKDAAKFFKGTKFRKLLIIQDGNLELYKSFRNLENVNVKSLTEVGVYDFVNAQNVLFTGKSLDKAEEFWSKK